MDDVISRQAALVAVKDALMAWSYMPEWRDEKILEAIAELPSAEPKRETTTLRIGRTRNSVTMWYECAECGEPVDQEDAFCRRCGRGIIHE